MMATIKLHANKINQMSGLLTDVKKSVSDYKSDLSSLRNKTLKINSSVCNVDDVISSIQASTQTQDQKIESLENLQKDSEQFISDVVQADSRVAEVINNRKNDFYKEYSYLKPEHEKGLWDKIKEMCKKFSQWCKDNWKALTVFLLVTAVVAIAIVSGAWAALPLILKGPLVGMLSGGTIGAIASMFSGQSLLEGMLFGALRGALMGAVGGLGVFLGKSCIVLQVLGGKLMPLIFKTSFCMSIGMLGFDILSIGMAKWLGPDNFLTSFNQRLNSNTWYKAFRWTTITVAAFTGGFTKGMQNPVCFVKGTMILTAAGLVAIESIESGTKVISTKEGTFEVAEKAVVETYIRETTKLVHLTIRNELISTTYEHPFYVRERGFVAAGELTVGDELLDSKGNVQLVQDSRLEVLDKPIEVYNFQVEDFHTYHVGSNGVLVHNACKGAGVTKAKDMAKQIKENNGTPPSGYKGGKIYKNQPVNGGQKLPEGINYKEYDINPYVKGQGRGTERIVIGDDGSVWYTNDHYHTFIRIE